MNIFIPDPRRSAYNAASTAGSNWGGNNYLLRDRVASDLGPCQVRRRQEKGTTRRARHRSLVQQDENQGGPKRDRRPMGHAALDPGGQLGQGRSAQRGLCFAWAEAHPSEVAAWKTGQPRQRRTQARGPRGRVLRRAIRASTRARSPSRSKRKPPTARRRKSSNRPSRPSISSRSSSTCGGTSILAPSWKMFPPTW